MHHVSFSALLRRLTPAERRGPVALVLVQDALLVPETFEALTRAGIAVRLALGPGTAVAGATHSAPFDVHAPGAWSAASAALIAAVPGAWVLPCWNGERPVWPHGDTRSLRELFTFLEEERRPVLSGIVLDSYPVGGAWQVDAAGYAQSDGEVTGGLRQRLGPPCPAARHRIDRVLAVKARRGLWWDGMGRLNYPDLDQLHGPWHRSPTAALISPRVWAWLAARPGHRERNFPLEWPGSVTLDGSATQLWELGLVAPGQWV